MASIKLSELTARGRDHEDAGFDGEYFEPPKGAVMKVKVVKVNGTEQEDGTPTWGVWNEVTAGEHKGKRFWVNIKFSAQWDFLNKQALAHLEGYGISADFLAGDPSIEKVAAVLETKTAVVTAGYRKNKKNPDKPWFDPTVNAAVIKAPPPPVEEDDDDEYLSGDDDDDLE